MNGGADAGSESVLVEDYKAVGPWWRGGGRDCVMEIWNWIYAPPQINQTGRVSSGVESLQGVNGERAYEVGVDTRT